MEIKTSDEILRHLNSIDSLDHKYDEYLYMYSNAKWVLIKTVLSWIHNEKIKLNAKIEDSSIPNICQANISGRLLELKYLEKEIFDKGD